MNPAVHVNDEYRSVFPPDVHAVMDHGRRDVSTFPIATGTYYKVDYSPGTDISRYKNIPVPTSYMAEKSDFDFLAFYDAGKNAGGMLLANHHIAPGKKQWTWGNGDFGQSWDRQLTDEDGPYAELMFGAYTDNQPDFSWIQPGEEKRFTAWLLPYKATDGVTHANKDAVVNLKLDGQQARIGVYLTSARIVSISLTKANGDVLFEAVEKLSPENAFTQTVQVAGATLAELTLRVVEGAKELIAYTPPAEKEAAVPDPATPAKAPHEIASSDELYLNGQHLEQYRHATFAPEPYYLEALRRDPLDSRCNNAMGLLLYRRGQFAEAEAYFRAAVKSITRRNPNPYYSEPYYNLGLTLKMQGKDKEAFDSFYKAIWNAAWQDSGYFELARLACRAARYAEALELAERSLARNIYHHAARHLKIALLRHLERGAAVEKEIALALELDCLNFGALYEKFLLSGDTSYRTLMRGNANTYVEIALDYAAAGLFGEAILLINEAPADAMARYYLGWFHLQAGRTEAARQAFAEAAQIDPAYTFPNQLECVLALQAAIDLQPGDARAPYYLGNFLYAHKRYPEAIALWERSAALDPEYATVQRNLGQAYLNKQNDPAKALEAYELAFALDPADARIFYELDGVQKRLNEAPEARLKRMEQHLDLVAQRDDLTVERASLLNLLGRYREALDLLLGRNFHPWEGGEGKVTGQYAASLVELAKARLNAGEYAEALADLRRAQSYPHNLGEGKLYSIHENNIDYLLGVACEALGDTANAQKHFRAAAEGDIEPTLPMYYNDTPPEMIYYQGLALQKLGQPEAARHTFQKLIDYGAAHLNQPMTIDYFAVSLPEAIASDEDLDRFNRINCLYLLGLGALGLGDTAQARENFAAALRLNPYHLGAKVHGDLTPDPSL
jgi:tetratricopeptide (TPR) repeat protein